MCFPWLRNDLHVYEIFFGFYQITDVPAKTIETESMLENTSMRLLLPIAECRGQYCDAASNIMG